MIIVFLGLDRHDVRLRIAYRQVGRGVAGISSGILPFIRLAIADGTFPFCVKSLAQPGT